MSSNEPRDPPRQLPLDLIEEGSYLLYTVPYTSLPDFTEMEELPPCIPVCDLENVEYCDACQ